MKASVTRLHVVCLLPLPGFRKRDRQGFLCLCRLLLSLLGRRRFSLRALLLLKISDEHHAIVLRRLLLLRLLCALLRLLCALLLLLWRLRERSRG